MVAAWGGRASLFCRDDRRMRFDEKRIIIVERAISKFPPQARDVVFAFSDPAGDLLDAAARSPAPHQGLKLPHKHGMGESSMPERESGG